MSPDRVTRFPRSFLRSPHMQLARVGAFIGAVTAAVAASVFAAAPAHAHTPVFTAGCEGEKSTLTVDLTYYDQHETNKNTVKIMLGEVEIENTTFGRDF